MEIDMENADKLSNAHYIIFDLTASHDNKKICILI